MRSIALDFRLGKQVLVNGSLFVIEALDGASHVVLQRVGNAAQITITRNELAKLAITGQYSDADTPALETKNRQPPFKLDKLTDEQRSRVIRRLSYVNAVVDLHPIGPKNPLLRMRINDTAARLKDLAPPSPHSVYRWLRRFVLSDHDPAAFARDACVVRRRKSRLDDGVQELLSAKLMDELTSSKGATVRGVFDKVVEQVACTLGHSSFRSITGETTLVNATAGGTLHERHSLAMLDEDGNDE